MALPDPSLTYSELVTTPRLYLPFERAFNSGLTVSLSREQSHYLRAVLRLREGTIIRVFNAQRGEWLASLAFEGKKDATLQIENCLRDAQEETGPWLLFAPVKKAQTDLIIQKAVELGVEKIIPVETKRSNSQRINLERFEAIAVEAAEQCERLTIPVIEDIVPLHHVLSCWSEHEDALSHQGTVRPLLLCAESGSALPITQGFQEHAKTQPLPAILVGPEGGFERSELDALAQLDFVTNIGLGPRILRAETAVIAALAIVQAWCGDWQMSPPGRR